MKAISQSNLNINYKTVVERQLKLFYFNAFRRRPKNLLTLELIKECYSDQIILFNNKIKKIITDFKISKDNSLALKKLNKLKKTEGCNKKILESVIAELSKNKMKITQNEIDNLLFFEDQ